MAEKAEHKAGRITTLDTMKGLAMIFVIFDHCGYTLHPVIDHIEVPVFFLISGYLLNAKAGFAAFIKRKAYTLLVPYLVFSLLYVFPYRHAHPDAGWLGGTFQLLVEPANQPLWFIKALFYSLAGYYFIIRVLMHRPLWVEAVVNILIATGVCAVLTFVSFDGMHLLLSTGLVQGIEALPLVGFGHLAARLSAEHPSKLGNASKASIFALALVIALCTSIEPVALYATDLGGNPWLFYPSALSCGVVFAFCCRSIEWLAPLNYVGRSSLTFFGFHAIAIFIAAEIIVMPKPLLPIAAILLCVPVAMAWPRIFKH